MVRVPSSAPKRIGARQRSEALLRDLLGADEYERLTQRGYLEVQSRTRPERAYHIPRDGGFVTVFERGEPVDLLCIGPTARLPPADVVILHKLLIEADEENYLQTANHMPLGIGDWRIVRGRVRLAVTPWQDW
jgi:hypothetical protein